MVVSKEFITSYIPHRAPFIMVDNLVNITQERFETDFLIELDNILVENGIFQETGLIENIAQTCALSFGYLGSQDGNEAKIGFIGAISKLEVFGLPPVTATIQTIVSPLHQLGNIYLVKGESFLEGRILLGCEMKIVVAE
jgi:predicted hotdog family 3-hydroxylacyl-ACP dehydratase